MRIPRGALLGPVGAGGVGEVDPIAADEAPGAESGHAAELTLASSRPWPRKFFAGVAIVSFFAIAAILAQLLAPYAPNAQDLLARLASPSAAHLLGTDDVGRDVLSRLIYAARVDLPVALLAILFPFLIGMLVGCLAGYYGGAMDLVVTRVADVVQAFPVYVLILALIAVLGPGAKSIIVASTIVSWVAYARLARGELLRARTLDYVSAARSGGLSGPRVLWKHILPNVIAQPVVYFMSDMVGIILILSALTFLGVGIPAPTAEWGRMIADAQPYITTDWWLILPPGLMIVLLGVGFSLIADGLDDRLRS
jgi:peptide/nickel transport system permease protein